MSTRIARLEHDFQQEIATIIQREVKDPRMGFVTVTRVQLSRDLSQAKVWYSCLGSDEERLQSQQVLESSARYVRMLLRKRFHLKIIPVLEFRYDESIVGSIELAKTFDRLRQSSQPQ